MESGFRIDAGIRRPCQPSMPSIAYHWAVSVSDLGAKFAGSNSGHHWGLSVSTSVDLTEHMDADGTSLWRNPFWPFLVQVPLDDKWQVCPTVFHSGQKMCWHYHDNIWKFLLCISFESPYINPRRGALGKHGTMYQWCRTGSCTKKSRDSLVQNVDDVCIFWWPPWSSCKNFCSSKPKKHPVEGVRSLGS